MKKMIVLACVFGSDVVKLVRLCRIKCEKWISNSNNLFHFFKIQVKNTSNGDAQSKENMNTKKAFPNENLILVDLPEEDLDKGEDGFGSILIGET